MPSFNTLEECQAFVTTSTPAAIAACILQDQQLCRERKTPSLLVYCLPQHTDRIACAIHGGANIPISVARMRLASIVSVIKTHLATLESPARMEDAIPTHMVPSDTDFNAALKVLRYLQLPQLALCSDPSTPIESVVTHIESQLSQGTGLRGVTNRKGNKRKPCYICRYVVNSPHRLYPALCNPCGEFNISSSSLSLPSNLDLSGKFALVTGGRVNLGFNTALRLLRCGAHVIVSSRYPLDAQIRYLAEPDASSWQSRLKVVGADFRSAKDVFALVNGVLGCLKDWNINKYPKLDVLINNAAQTLTDSVEKEEASVQREIDLQDGAQVGVVLGGDYSPRIRGGVHTRYNISATSSSAHPSSNVSVLDEGNATTIASHAILSSWTQRISDVPYEDVISAHSVNTFVPFILVRELLPFMSSPTQMSPSDPPSQSNATKPTGYIINVSSREGLFEDSPNHRAKDGHHVHTNMSKAALNMLTETEAGPAWKNGRVAMNTVDPGYMSADPVFMEKVGRADEPCPIGWEDGAARVLWPIAQGEKGHIIRGRFLKHFSGVEAVR